MAISQFRHLIKTISPSAKISNVRSIFNSNGWNYNEIFPFIKNDFSSDVHFYSDLSNVLPKVDIISIHSSSQVEIISKNEYDQMKEGIHFKFF